MTEAAFITIEPADLAIFSLQEDLFGTACTKTFNSSSIDQTITDSAHRALQVCNAQAQLMLAQYQSDTVDHMLCARTKAEDIAYKLGEYDFDPERLRRNPFEEKPLRDAWDKGFQEARNNGRDRSLTRLQNKFWEEGINTEDARSQFELCALQLYRLAAELKQPEQAARAKGLAMEMCRYHEGETPTPRRQQEIDRFMARQAERLALALEF